MQARQMLRNGVFSTTSLIALLPESLYSENGLAKHRKITFKNRQLTNLGWLRSLTEARLDYNNGVIL